MQTFVSFKAFMEISKEQEDNDIYSDFEALSLEEEEVSDPVNSKVIYHSMLNLHTYNRVQYSFNVSNN